MKTILQFNLLLAFLFVTRGVSAGPSLIFSEIMYNPVGSSETNGEWIEIFNAGDVVLDLTGYSIDDDIGSGGPFIFSSGIFINPGQTLTIARNLSGFTGGFTPDLGSFAFALNNGGDVLRLFDAGGTQIDVVAWKNALPGWNLETGDGQTLRRLSTGAGPAAWLGNQAPSPGDPDGLSAVPEPATVLLFSGGLMSIGLWRKKRRRTDAHKGRT